MGQVYEAVKLKELFIEYGIENFVETGSGIGDTITQIIINKPENINIFTIELMDELHANLVTKFGDIPYLNLLKGYSHEQIRVVIDQISDKPTLFWHDAHFPGADFGIGGATYTSESDPIKRIPLHAELQAIKDSGRDITNDVIISDDLWIYEDGPYEVGNWHLRTQAGGDGVDFVYEMFSDTHHIFKSYAKQGFLILLPKKGHTPEREALIR
jgi:hypothetical protein